MITLSNVETQGGEESPPGVRLASVAPPDAKSTRTGVSVEIVSLSGIGLVSTAYIPTAFIEKIEH